MLDQGLIRAPKLIERTDRVSKLLSYHDLCKLLSSPDWGELYRYGVQKIFDREKAFDLGNLVCTSSTKSLVLILIPTLLVH